MTKPSIDKATPQGAIGEVIVPSATLEQLRTQNAALREALEKIRDECHPRDLKDVEGLCSGCVAGRALEEVK